MIRRVTPPDPPLFADVTPKVAAAVGDLNGTYGAPFWLTYIANAMMMISFSLLYRYSDFVHLLGGTEFQLGLIVGLGMVGSLSMRVFQGIGIDRYGSKQVWLFSNAVYVASLLGHLLATRADSPYLYLLRIILQTSIAGVFGASITYISRRAPLPRVAEIVGTLGTSGFVGMMAGTTLGDLLCRSLRPTREEIDRLFIAAACMAAGALLFAILATRGQSRPLPRRHPPLFWLLKRYHPGLVLLMGVATGFGVGLPTIFLRPYLAELGIPGMAVFFWAYTIIAFSTRISIRRVPERFGIRPMILVGIGSLSISMLMYLTVSSRWHLLGPALFVGIAHALLFPAIVAGGSTAFPTRFRGLGTTLMLSAVDLGSLFGFPVVGAILQYSKLAGLPPYQVMFLTATALLMLCGVIYFLMPGHASKHPPRRLRLHRHRPRRDVDLAAVK